MNWYKMAQPNNWKDVKQQLRDKLGREPTSGEVQNKMLEEDFSDENKKSKADLVLTSSWKDKLPGGNADKDTPADYDKTSVEKGKKIEFEHTDDADTAREIAIDHLDEHKDYYVGLEHMENALEEIENREKK